MAKVIQLITKGATEQISTVIVGASSMGNPLIIKAQKGVHYELRDATTHFAPHQVLLVRKGKDLLIKLDMHEDESDKAASPDIVIENYYGYGDYSGNLVGMSEDGQYYNYAPQEGNSDLFSVNMDNGDTSYQSLGYSDVTTETNWLLYLLPLAVIPFIHHHHHNNNDAPIAADDTGSVNEDSTLNVIAAAGVLNNDTDPDGDPLTVTAIRTGTESGSGTSGTVGSSLAGTYGHLTLNSDGSYSYVADNANELAVGATATDTFTYTVSDGNGGTDTAELVITITGTNDAPIAVNDTNSTNEDTTLTVLVGSVDNLLHNDSDPDGDPLT
ncbi:MAG: cadherin-like domain-containing protein, partial [Sulfurovaceae bacterium]|nr:cadherin-like domain-containing protein [Sulfurovaceae bacterium]